MKQTKTLSHFIKLFTATTCLVLISTAGIFSQQVQYKEWKDVPAEYKWNLSEIYSSWEDWEADLSDLQGLLSIAQNSKGNLGKDPETLFEALQIKDKIIIQATKLNAYFSLLRSIDGRNPEAMQRGQKLQNAFVLLEKDFSWYEPELASLDKNKILGWAKEKENLRQYNHYLSDFYRTQEHILPEEMQRVISTLSIPLGAGEYIYNSLSVSDIQFEKVKLSTGEEITASMPEMERILTTNKNQDDRKKVADANLLTFTKNKYTYAEIFASILQSRWGLTQIYKFPSCLENVLSGDNIPKEVYLNYIDVTASNLQPFHKYLELRKKALGLEKFYKSDLSVSLVDYNKTYSYEQAMDIIKNALYQLGGEYRSRLDKFLAGGSIDVFPVPGKRSGAFSSDVPEVHPYILMNFAGTRGNMFTLVHEIGHSTHSIFANENQPPATRDYPTFVAEVASIFNELVLMDYLVKNSKDPVERIDLLTQEIDNLSRKFFRVASLAEFEYKSYQLVENDEPVDIETLANLFDDIEKKYYGDLVIREEGEKYGWSRTLHFFTKYYYLFQYATSYS
ncbi:MAG: M3 family oligoendopeptidase, partial [bacterium]